MAEVQRGMSPEPSRSMSVEFSLDEQTAILSSCAEQVLLTFPDAGALQKYLQNMESEVERRLELIQLDFKAQEARFVNQMREHMGLVVESSWARMC